MLVVGIEQVVEFFGLGMLFFLRFPELGTETAGLSALADGGVSVIISAGKYCFFSGMIIGLPLLATALICDFVYLVSCRYVPKINWSISLKLPLIVLVLLLILPRVSSQVVTITRDTLDKESVREMGTPIVKNYQNGSKPAAP